ncbi:MAG: hypothetical protein BHW65_08910 [Verrucomicrobia bacterium CAG:312_58_20]|nr:MAG: hypothetical protein BHW65_08910 [Verrucomicrobia bacterium CAG:312_58_20]
MSRNFLVFIFPFVLIGFAKAILRQIRRRVNMHCFQKSAQSRLFLGETYIGAPQNAFFSPPVASADVRGAFFRLAPS